MKNTKNFLLAGASALTVALTAAAIDANKEIKNETTATHKNIHKLMHVSSNTVDRDPYKMQLRKEIFHVYGKIPQTIKEAPDFQDTWNNLQQIMTHDTAEDALYTNVIQILKNMVEAPQNAEKHLAELKAFILEEDQYTRFVEEALHGADVQLQKKARLYLKLRKLITLKMARARNVMKKADNLPSEVRDMPTAGLHWTVRLDAPHDVLRLGVEGHTLYISLEEFIHNYYPPERKEGRDKWTAFSSHYVSLPYEFPVYSKEAFGKFFAEHEDPLLFEKLHITDPALSTLDKWSRVIDTLEKMKWSCAGVSAKI